MLDHLLASCQLYFGDDTDPMSETSSSNLVIPGKLLAFLIFLCDIIEVLTHNCVPVHTEKLIIPKGLLEALDWQDERSFDGDHTGSKNVGHRWGYFWGLG